MPRIRYVEERETLLDHLVSAVVSAFAMFLMVALVPIVAMLGRTGHGNPQALSFYATMHVWGLVLVALAFIVGAIAGPKRMAVLWGHLWATEEPRREGLTFGLWMVILVIITVTILLN